MIRTQEKVRHCAYCQLVNEVPDDDWTLRDDIEYKLHMILDHGLTEKVYGRAGGV